MTLSRPDTVQPRGVSRQVTIETPRVVLRGARPSDAEDLFECFSDPEVMRYWETLPHANVATTRSWVDKMVNGQNNGITDFVICLKPTRNISTSPVDAVAVNEKDLPRKVIGKIGIWQDDEIGFLLNRTYWRQGLAFGILPEVIDLAFNLRGGSAVNERAEWRIDIVADVDPRNVASLGVLQKLGFEIYATKEKTFKIGDEWVDSVYLKLEKDRWMKRRKEMVIK